MIARIGNGLYCKTSAKPTRIDQYQGSLRQQVATAPKEPKPPAKEGK